MSLGSADGKGCSVTAEKTSVRVRSSVAMIAMTNTRPNKLAIASNTELRSLPSQNSEYAAETTAALDQIASPVLTCFYEYQHTQHQDHGLLRHEGQFVAIKLEYRLRLHEAKRVRVEIGAQRADAHPPYDDQVPSAPSKRVIEKRFRQQPEPHRPAQAHDLQQRANKTGPWPERRIHKIGDPSNCAQRAHHCGFAVAVIAQQDDREQCELA